MTDQRVQELKAAARSAASHAYAKYSNFRVGAAILTGSGKIVSGCNVENASYGLSICAERNAVFHAVATGEERIETLVVYTPTSSPTPPCGACRQVLAEFGPEMRIICVCDGPEILEAHLRDLLPLSFGPGTLLP